MLEHKGCYEVAMKGQVHVEHNGEKLVLQMIEYDNQVVSKVLCQVTLLQAQSHIDLTFAEPHFDVHTQLELRVLCDTPDNKTWRFVGTNYLRVKKGVDLLFSCSEQVDSTVPVLLG